MKTKKYNLKQMLSEIKQDEQANEKDKQVLSQEKINQMMKTRARKKEERKS